MLASCTKPILECIPETRSGLVSVRVEQLGLEEELFRDT